jgi:MFS family permease
VLLAIGVGTFMAALDGSVVNVVLPLLSRELGASVAGIEWVMTIYLLVVSGLCSASGAPVTCAATSASTSRASCCS